MKREFDREAQGKFGEDFVFTYPNRRPIKPDILARAWKRYARSPVSLYEATRHSFGTQIVETPGATVQDAQTLLRHSDIRSTQHYLHLTTSRVQQLVNRRGKVVPFKVEEK
jgi:site-specific recombinase XerD